jgi:hypothetical protein
MNLATIKFLVVVPLGHTIRGRNKNSMDLISRMIQAFQIKAFINRTLMAIKINNSSTLACQSTSTLACQSTSTHVGIPLCGWTQGNSPGLLQDPRTTVMDGAGTTILLIMDPLFRNRLIKAIKILLPPKRLTQNIIGDLILHRHPMNTHLITIM